MNRTLLCRFRHKFGEWSFLTANSCNQVRICVRDGFEQRRVAPHQFGEWSYLGDTCKQEHVCIRCGQAQSRDAHEWDFIQTDTVCGGGNRYGDNVEQTWNKYQCSRCGQTKEDLVDERVVGN